MKIIDRLLYILYIWFGINIWWSKSSFKLTNKDIKQNTVEWGWSWNKFLESIFKLTKGC